MHNGIKNYTNAGEGYHQTILAWPFGYDILIYEQTPIHVNSVSVNKQRKVYNRAECPRRALGLGSETHGGILFLFPP